MVKASDRPPSPSGLRKWLAVTLLALVATGAVVYTVIASREAALETDDDAKILDRRIREMRAGFFSKDFSYTLQPRAGCADDALDMVNGAVRKALSGVPALAMKELEAAI